MKNLIFPLLAFFLSSCAANPAVYQSTAQNYRPKGDDQQLNINGRLVHKKNLLDDDYAVVFSVNSKYALGFQLDSSGNGALSCNSDIESDKGSFACHPQNGKPIGANCLGSTVNGKLSSVQCSFSYDNETAANFKF